LIDKSGRLDQGKLREDLDNVRELYQNKGFVEVDIPETRIERLASGDINLVVVIGKARSTASERSDSRARRFSPTPRFAGSSR